MKHFHYCITLIVACLGNTISSGQFQVIHDQPNTTTTPRLRPVILNDGSTVTHHYNGGSHIFRKYDQSGGVLWSKGFSGPQSIGFFGDDILSMVPNGANEFLIFKYSGYNSVWVDSLNNPIETHFFDITRVDGAGNITSSHTVSREFESMIPYLVETVDHAPTPDGGSVLMISYRHAASGWIEIHKLSTDGDLQWSRGVGNGQGGWIGTPFPIPTFDSHPIGALEVASDGSIYYIEGGTYLSHLRLAKISPDGDMEWMRTYQYGNNVTTIEYHDIKLDQAGGIHAAGSLVTTVGRFHIFLAISSDGDLERADIYRTPFITHHKNFGIDGNGRRLHFVMTNLAAMGGGMSQGILVADTLGSPALFVQRDDLIVLPNNVFVMPQSMNVANDRIAVSGLLHHEHVDLAFTTRYETLQSFHIEEIYSCFMNDTTLAHIEVPLTIMTTHDVPNAVSLDVLPFYDSQQNPIAWTDQPLDPLDTLCVYGYNLLGIETGIEEDRSEMHAPLLIQSLLSVGSPLQLNDIGAAEVEIWSSSGALVDEKRLVSASGRSIPTHGWNAGMYFVRALDEYGIAIRTERFMLE